MVIAHYGLSPDRLRQLSALESVEEVVAALPSQLRGSLHGSTDIPGLFAHLETMAADTAYGVLHSGAPAIARAFAYLILRELDLRDVRAVLRGRHLGLQRDAIGMALRRTHEGGL